MLRKLFRRFKKEESGATMVEYAVAVGVVLIAGVVGFANMGGQAKANFEQAAGKMKYTP